MASIGVMEVASGRLETSPLSVRSSLIILGQFRSTVDFHPDGGQDTSRHHSHSRTGFADRNSRDDGSGRDRPQKAWITGGFVGTSSTFLARVRIIDWSGLLVSRL
jgi:hypothetical protein